jgi:tRNA(fMet)-specific endonuclease VapC
MSDILLDTSAYSAFLRGHIGVKQALQLAPRICLSAVVLGELHGGFRHGRRRRENELLLQQFLRSPRTRPVQIDFDTADCYAEILTYLRNQGTPVPTNDVWIAASAMQHGLRVLTTDAHFEKIPQVRTLRFEVE